MFLFVCLFALFVCLFVFLFLFVYLFVVGFCLAVVVVFVFFCLFCLFVCLFVFFFLGGGGGVEGEWLEASLVWFSLPPVFVLFDCLFSGYLLIRFLLFFLGGGGGDFLHSMFLDWFLITRINQFYFSFFFSRTTFFCSLKRVIGINQILKFPPRGATLS